MNPNNQEKESLIEAERRFQSNNHPKDPDEKNTGRLPDHQHRLKDQENLRR
ncbi:hypothetical protein JOC77_003329 [Peribacillus deserti]|uniref:Uncharacterized protein n=1 Tax=Peribacillus deserti TaxID=673318 RepID=A0ABS2QLK4_9BACI|nr:hypothetical protein [Peribacillus deserti]MBM7693885.1 hypothetical protein [Peribacillus deserti]